jgi:D-alanyl-lipoteichoic acid acyltransferase DltB (MBOAT superfamily)
LISFPRPEPLFNPLTAPADHLLTGWEILAGPFGLIAFIPLVPLLRLIARARRRTALIVCGLVWLVATTGPVATLVLLAGCLVASGWVVLLGQLMRDGRVGPRLMTALVWLGLAGMLFPLWWYPQWSWYGWHNGSRMAVLHNIGVAYFFLRLIAWGVELARNPHDPWRPGDTVCWLLYPPCMRLGPVLLRHEFLERLEAWNPTSPAPWKEVGQRFGLFAVGVIGLGVVLRCAPVVAPGAADFFESPQAYTTGELLRVFYLLPIEIYFLLWTYNELAAALALWIGIRVDNNFDWLPRAASVRDFWRRWHVTVGRWLRDYIYLALGGNRGLVPLHYAGVFGFCAVWHGASWSFVAWGASQTLALTVQRWWDQGRRWLGWVDRPAGRWWTMLCWLATMHFQIATIIVFVDFEHLGGRLFRELTQRLFLPGTA